MNSHLFRYFELMHKLKIVGDIDITGEGFGLKSVDEGDRLLGVRLSLVV